MTFIPPPVKERRTIVIKNLVESFETYSSDGKMVLGKHSHLLVVSYSPKKIEYCLSCSALTLRGYGIGIHGVSTR